MILALNPLISFMVRWIDMMSTRIANVAFRVSEYLCFFCTKFSAKSCHWCVSLDTRVAFLEGFNQWEALNDRYNPAVSSSVSADFIPVYADESTLPPGQSLGSSANTTRFPLPSDVCMDQLSSGIFTSSSYDDDFSATLTNLAPVVDVNPVPTRRVNTIHPQSQILGDLASPVLTRSRAQKSKFGESAFIGLVQDQTNDHHTINFIVIWLLPLLSKPTRLAKSLRILIGLLLCKQMQAIHQPGKRGTIDKTLFIKKDSRDIILVQVYVDDIIFGSTNTSLVKQLPDGIFISQDKYVKDMLTKFDMESVRTATTPYEAAKTKLKDETDPPVNVHLYRSMIGSLMYLTASRPDIMFAVSACSRHQVTPLTSHLNAVKKIFKYLKGQPKLGLWYPKDSPFQLEAYSDSDYAGSHGDRKSTTGGCQFLGRRLISWQCKKQTIVATSSTEAEYVAAASCCAQVLWIQNQLLDYGFNFMNTKIFIDNQSTICIVKNPVFHQRTKHIEIRHHFIRDANEKNLIQVLKIHTDDNVADLLTKAFDGPRFEYLVVHIGMVDMVLVSAGSTMILLVDSFLLIGCVFLLCAWFLLLVDSFCWLNTFMLLELFMLSIHLFMLLNCFCCAQFDIAGWLVSATSHLVSAGSLQSCWCNNVSAE
ncbi:hypothetical protein Tco_1102240 [Tanacetum coccineum]